MEETTNKLTTITFPKSNNGNVMDGIIGPYAAKNNVSLETSIRASTTIEREYAKQRMHLLETSSSSSSSSRRGLNVRDEIGDEINTIIIQIKQMTDDSGSAGVKVKDFKKLLLLLHDNNNESSSSSSSLVCNLSLICLAKRAVELGAFAIATTTTEADDNDNDNDNDKTTTTNKLKRKDDDISNEEEEVVSSKHQKT